MPLHSSDTQGAHTDAPAAVISPRLAELLASAQSEHLRQKGPGSHDVLLAALHHATDQQENSPHLAAITLAIRRVQELKDGATACTCTRTRKRVRDSVFYTGLSAALGTQGLAVQEQM